MSFGGHAGTEPGEARLGSLVASLGDLLGRRDLKGVAAFLSEVSKRLSLGFCLGHVVGL
jgi:hypothetical protein